MAISHLLDRVSCCVRVAGAVLVASILCLPLSANEVPRALPAGELPNDVRLEPLKDLNGYFPFQVPETPDQWQQRAAKVRQQLLVSLGLWPMPEKMPLEPQIHGKIEKDDYTVERVYFESLPGFYVTGSLYRPKNVTGKVPGVLCPHGHWSNGRFYDAGEATARQQIEKGAEKFMAGARSPLQARCVHLARMGCVVFHYDMIGYADSTQFSFELAHRFATQRENMSGPDGWGLFSPRAVSYLQSVMGLQSYNSIRALDFIESLPDVDPNRLAVTGASGGGTQTFILAAIEPRVALAFPAVMVSTAMQGGCTCENCSLLRVDTGNVEFAGLFAPKPLGLSAADDWTKEMETKGFPELQKLYEMLGAPDNVAMISRTEFGHNYNQVCREFMYKWINRHFDLNAEVEERDFERLSNDEMTVWTSEHPQPDQESKYEQERLKAWHDSVQEQLAALTPGDETELDEYRAVIGQGVSSILGRSVPAGSELEWEQTFKEDRGDYLLMTGLLDNTTHSEQVPLLFLYPKDWNGKAVVWLHEEGKKGLFGEDGKPAEFAQRLIDAGTCVAGVDLLFQGEFLSDGEAVTETRTVENPRQAAGYTLGYNHSLLSRRVHDVMNVVSFMRSYDLTPETVLLVGTGSTAPIAAAARSQCEELVDGAAIDSGGFRFADVPSLRHPSFLPGGGKYGDLPGMLSLSAPYRLWLTGEGEQAPEIVTRCYQAASAEGNLTYQDLPKDEVTGRIVDWLIETEF